MILQQQQQEEEEEEQRQCSSFHDGDGNSMDEKDHDQHQQQQQAPQHYDILDESDNNTALRYCLTDIIRGYQDSSINDHQLSCRNALKLLELEASPKVSCNLLLVLL
jgi:hypothetical protein